MDEDYVKRLERQRENREAFFETDANSPIAPTDRGDSFPGLAYYAPDPDYRFELPLRKYDEVETLTVGTSTDGEREYHRWGEFRFEIDGETHTLQAYKGDPEDDSLWVPFRDETNGEETYGAGRYLDLDPDRHRLDSGEWVLDFNEAYNPTCAYNEAYECPLIPTENWLDVRVEAGEKDYPGVPASPHAHEHPEH